MGVIIKILLSSLLLTLCFQQNSFAAKKAPSKKKVSLSRVHNKIRKQGHVIRKLKKQISRLESNLGDSNKRYLSIVTKKKEIEVQFYEINNNLEKEQKRLEEEVFKSRKLLSGVLVNRFSADQSMTGLLGQKVLVKELGNRIVNMEKALGKIKNQRKDISDLESRLVEYRNLENELGQLLSGLELQKREKTTKYLIEVDRKDKLQASYDRLRSKKLRKMSKKDLANIGYSFNSPLGEYVGMEFDKKGVTYKYKGRKPVLTTAAGKIMYQGTLSNFGNVIMIDHGKETRSIILGKFVPKVAKGTRVRKGDVLGYTRDSRNQEEKLYFEVRQKNKVQNTILLLDRKSLAKNDVKSDNT
ncbi:MAG: peptidoglycan DD-metalloendopeptidase family protein [Bacteriovoracaceae bacterium]|nr:peptidoglycan DD-metalloendopeptidase family protein [Bacteriovoracaceae bacterium]